MPPRLTDRKRGTPEARVRLQVGGGIAEVTLEADGEVRMGEGTHGELVSVVRELDLDESVRVVLLRSTGTSFCSGDLASSFAAGCAACDGIEAIASIRQPVVVAIDGAALDEGLELALACDLRVASTRSRLGLTQVSRAGRIPRRGGTQRLPRTVGRARATTMLLLGEILSARQAAAAGLLHRVGKPSSLLRDARAVAGELAKRAPVALRLAKEALLGAYELPLREGLRFEGDLYVLLQTTSDRDEGLASFGEKRSPRFRGR